MEQRLAVGRDAFDRQAWGRAFQELSTAAEQEPLAVDDLERLAAAAYLTGRTRESSDSWAKAHQECTRVGEIGRAARCAFWLAFGLLNNGELERGRGWVDRAQRLLDDGKLECVERGYLRYAAGLCAIFSGDGEAAFMGFEQAAAAGTLYRDHQLSALARIGVGRCLIYGGEIDAGLALLDEAMVAVETGELSPIAVGDAYCTVIDGCVELFDIRRAQVWTAALGQWCDSQPELVLYKTECLVHRAEVRQLRGEWEPALRELEEFVARLADPNDRMLGAIEYLKGELHRLRGEFSAAERAYRAAGTLGRDTQPGLARLRMEQGRVDASQRAISRALAEADEPTTRARLLEAFVDIAIAGGDVASAETASSELSALADRFDQPYLRARASYAVGVVALARGDAERAVGQLRAAGDGWHELDAPYEHARARVAIGLACRALADEDGAAAEFDGARAAFAALGAAPAIAAVAALLDTGSPRAVGGLSPREQQVLALVARGKSNREIAAAFVISEKTVASHISHILTKLGLPSRTAAAAYAHEHGLLDGGM